MKSGIVTRPAWWKLVTAVSGLMLLAVACGSGGGAAPSGTSPAVPASSTPAAPATPQPDAALCADVAALRASLDKLTNVSVGAGSVSEITADLQEVQANLTAVVNDARGQWQAQASALKSALGKLQAAARTLTASPSTSAVSGVVTALGDVMAAARELLAAVSTRCPSASPTPSA